MKFYQRDTMSITNKPNHILEFRKYELTEKLEEVEYCNELKDILQ